MNMEREVRVATVLLLIMKILLFIAYVRDKTLHFYVQFENLKLILLSTHDLEVHVHDVTTNWRCPRIIANILGGVT